MLYHSDLNTGRNVTAPHAKFWEEIGTSFFSLFSCFLFGKDWANGMVRHCDTGDVSSREGVRGIIHGGGLMRDSVRYRVARVMARLVGWVWEVCTVLEDEVEWWEGHHEWF
jgi:hypothetical protein